MSLEKALEANTAASLELTKAIIALLYRTEQGTPLVAAANPAAAEVAKDNPVKPTTPETRKPVKSATDLSKLPQTAVEIANIYSPKAVAEGVERALARQKDKEENPEKYIEGTLKYDDIKTPFLELAKRDLAAAQKLLADLKVKNLKEVLPEQYADILEKLGANSEEGMA